MLSFWLFVGVLLAAPVVLIATTLEREVAARKSVLLVALLVLAALTAAWVLASDPYDLRKVVGVCLLPAGLVWLGLAALCWLLAVRGQRASTAVAAVLWLAYSLAGNVWVGHGLISWLEEDYVAVDPFALGRLDALAVLGGGTGVAPGGQVSVGEAGDRVLLAARLYRAGRVAALITSGQRIEQGGRVLASEPELTRRIWLELGVQPEHVILLEGPRSTSDEIRALRKLQDERRFARLGLLTSAYHLRRARRLCARYGLDVIPVPADFAAVMGPPRPMHLVPQSEGFRGVQHACWELLGALAGR